MQKNMKKTDQLIKELQMLVDKPELNGIIDEKMMGMWRDARRDCDKEWIERKEDFNKRQKAGLTPEETERMLKSHGWQQRDQYDDEETCYKCELDDRSFYECPQYCEVKSPAKD